MLRSFLKVTYAVAFLQFSAAQSLAELSTEQLEKLASYHYQTVSFATTEQELLQSLPAAKLEQTHKSSEDGVRTYEYRENVDGGCVLFRYFENSLVEIDIIYFPSMVAAKGGAESLTQEAVKRFGQPSEEVNDTLLWDFPSIDRLVVVSFERGKWSLHIYHRSRRLAISNYKDTSATPKKARIEVTEGLAVPYKSKDVHSVPEGVMVAITQQARIDHPNDLATQGYVIGKQVTAYHQLKSYECPEGIPQLVFEVLAQRAAQDHANDFSTQIYTLKKQVGAFYELAKMTAPEDMAGSHFFAFKNSASNRHPFDYSTQLYVLRKYINEYQEYRQAGNSGEGIADYLLRYD